MNLIQIILSILILLFGTAFFYLKHQGSQSQKMQTTLGLKNNQLTACPDKPNCVSSFAPQENSHYIPPFPTTNYPINRIKEICERMNLTIISEKENYLHVIHKSSLFGFIDDIEFLFTPELGLLHFRSASRVGHSDLSANRKRIERLKKSL